MDQTVKERGILKLEPRPRATLEPRFELLPQGSYERGPPSPQPSVDRLSVTFAEQASMASSGVNLFHLPSETPINNEVKFSTAGDEEDEDEDYSASLSAVLRQRRASVRRSRKGRTRRPSSPFLPDEPRPRRRSSAITTSSGDTAISMEEGEPTVSQEQIFENIHLHKEVLGSVKQQPLGMRRKLKIVHQAKTYIKRHEGQLQERLAQSKSTRDIYARFNIWMTTKWHQVKREAANTSNLLIPWELRIKEIECHFGSVVASYFTFLRWLFWVNLVIAFILIVFVIVPEYLTANPNEDGERKIIMEDEKRNATNLLTLWEFQGVLKYSPIFYGYYSNIEGPKYKMPLAYFLTGLVVYIYSFVAILRKMAENSHMSKLSEKEDECIFSWKLFTGWDFMIGNTETAHNRIASIILSFKEALLEEAEKKRDMRNWRIISLRALVNLCVLLLLVVSAYAVVTVVSRSDDKIKDRSWWRENETSIVVTVITITFPVCFELLGFLEHYHPRKQLRLQLARIMLLNLLNLYSLIFALFSKIEGMSKELDLLKPPVVNTSMMLDNSLNVLNQSFLIDIPKHCIEEEIPCLPCNVLFAISVNMSLEHLPISKNKLLPFINTSAVDLSTKGSTTPLYESEENYPPPENLIGYSTSEISETSESTTPSILQLELERLRNIGQIRNTTSSYDNDNVTIYDEDYIFDYESTTVSNPESTIGVNDYTTIETILNATTESNYTESITENTLAYDVSTTTDTESSETEKGEDESTTSSTSDTSYGNVYTETTGATLNTVSTSTSYIETTTSHETKTTAIPDYSRTVQVPRPTLDVFNTIGKNVINCPNITFNCTVNCDGKNITQVFVMSNCSIVRQACYVKTCRAEHANLSVQGNQTNATTVDIAFLDCHNRRMYNLTTATKKRLLKLCWETMFGQELIKLTMMDLVFVLLGTLFLDFFRSLFVRFFNRCWCWDLEKKFPEYGDFKIAENILHLINNQGMVWMGMFFSPGLVVLNVVKLMIMMYLRSWAVMTCNVPHEVVFRVSKSNNFYLALLLTMLFLCVLPVGYSIVWVKPSWHCGPFSEYEKIYYILTKNIYKILPKTLNFTLEYIASPAIVIPLLVLLILIIYYLTSLTNSLREANNDLKIQLRRERTEERRKMFQLADTRRRGGSSALDNTPFARWKKALPSLPISKSIDSDDRKTLPGDEENEPIKVSKKKGNIFAKIVGMALDRKTDVEAVAGTPDYTPSGSNNVDDETDTDFHETLPSELLKHKDITVVKKGETKKKSYVEFKTDESDKPAEKRSKSKVESNDSIDEIIKDNSKEMSKVKSKPVAAEVLDENSTRKAKLDRHHTSESSTQSRLSDSIGSVIPVIMISTTESDDEILQSKKKKNRKPEQSVADELTGAKASSSSKKTSSDLKSLRRQSSVDSVSEKKPSKEKKPDDGHKYQYSL